METDAEETLGVEDQAQDWKESFMNQRGQDCHKKIHRMNNPEHKVTH